MGNAALDIGEVVDEVARIGLASGTRRSCCLPHDRMAVGSPSSKAMESPSSGPSVRRTSATRQLGGSFSRPGQGTGLMAVTVPLVRSVGVRWRGEISGRGRSKKNESQEVEQNEWDCYEAQQAPGFAGTSSWCPPGDGRGRDRARRSEAKGAGSEPPSIRRFAASQLVSGPFEGAAIWCGYSRTGTCCRPRGSCCSRAQGARSTGDRSAGSPGETNHGSCL